MSDASDARRLMRSCRSGALATASKRLGGHPFVSIVPFMSDYDARPVMLISRLAEHTRNIGFDARVSLMVQEPCADVQATARLTLCGTCERIEATDALKDRYVRLFPCAADLLELDFEFHRLDPCAIRYIGGFGKVHWLAPESLFAAAGIDATVEAQWLARINGVAPQASTYRMPSGRALGADSDVRAVALDRDGIDIADGDRISRLDFPACAASPNDLLRAIQDLFAGPQA